jgi:hypothetical protein
MRNLAFVCVLAGCNSSSSTTIKTSPFAVTVMDGITMQPIAGAKLALDPAVGKRLEATSDAQGKHSFDVDWSKGPITVTGYTDGDSLASYLGVDKRDGLSVYLVSNTPPATTPKTVMGQISNKNMDTDDVTLSASVQAGYFQDVSANYTLTVDEDKAYQIYALDWVIGGKMHSGRGIAQTFNKWAQVDAPAPSQSTTVNIDFATATALTSNTASGSMTVPSPSATLLSKSRAYVTVTDLDSNYSSFLGAPTWIDISSDKTQFQYDLNWVQPQAITKPVTQYYISGNGFAYTAKVDLAFPSAGAITNLLEIPVVNSPGPGGVLQVGEAPDLDPPVESDAKVVMVVWSNAGMANAKRVWYLYPLTNVPLIAPALPTGVDADTVLPAGTLSALIAFCATAADGVRCERFAESDTFGFTR